MINIFYFKNNVFHYKPIVVRDLSIHFCITFKFSVVISKKSETFITNVLLNINIELNFMSIYISEFIL